MLLRYLQRQGRLEPIAPEGGAGEAVWHDLLHPTRDEEAQVEGALGLAIPTREEMSEIEASSRLYDQDGALFMTATVLHNIQSGEPSIDPISFILARDRLATVRYAEPRAFPLFVDRAAKGHAPCRSGPEIFLGLLESIVWRSADLLERIQAELNDLTHTAFEMRGAEKARKRGLDELLRAIGKQGAIAFRSNESVLSLNALANYYAAKLRETKRDGGEGKLRNQVRLLQRDLQSLSEHTDLLMQKIQFLLDATLGMINIQENRTIQIFSLLATIFMPPTLIASIYGMNFREMPELSWWFGYPMALGLITASGALSYYIFRYKGWL